MAFIFPIVVCADPGFGMVEKDKPKFGNCRSLLDGVKLTFCVPLSGQRYTTTSSGRVVAMSLASSLSFVVAFGFGIDMEGAGAVIVV